MANTMRFGESLRRKKHSPCRGRGTLRFSRLTLTLVCAMFTAGLAERRSRLAVVSAFGELQDEEDRSSLELGETSHGALNDEMKVEFTEEVTSHMSMSRLRFFPGFPYSFFLGMGGSMVRLGGLMAGGLACFGTLFSLFKLVDLRKFRSISRFLLWCGWDDFPGFRITLTVHLVKDVVEKSLIGKSKGASAGKGQYKVSVSFKWSKFVTQPTQDFAWEQSKSLEVPQGARTCTITLYKTGKIRDSKVGGAKFDVKRDMLDQDGFWGSRQHIKLESKGKVVGLLHATFRRDESASGTSSNALIQGLRQDSSLALEINKFVEEARSSGKAVPVGPLKGDDRLFLLSQVMTGPLREINTKGQDLGTVYVKVLLCNEASLQGEDTKEEFRRELEKAKKKGQAQPPKKWYWVCYEDKKTAEKNSTYAKFYFPMSAVGSVHRSPEHQGQFVIKYSHEKEKTAVIYRREGKKGLELWLEAIELFKEIQKTSKDKAPDVDVTHAQKLWESHQMWVKQNGKPSTQAQWKQWFNHLKGKGFSDAIIGQLYKQTERK
mmetsp:Transcript_26796/g.70419  ORF Transcript_26796/g.70419 Transcript_26796/m.70419 type:complete len:546 (-) Transcript_26796:109-1746(-)